MSQPIAPKERILCLAPFAPRQDAPHGGSRVIAQRLIQFTACHEVALACLREPIEQPIDPVLRERCSIVEEITRPPVRGTIAERTVRRTRHLRGFARGEPMWVTDCRVGRYAKVIGQLARDWQPTIILIDYQVMGQYLPALAASEAPKILIVHEPATAAARDMWKRARGGARLVYRTETIAWRGFEQRVFGSVHGIVAFSEADRAAVRQLAPRTLTKIISLGVPIPKRVSCPLGGSPPSVLFVGNFIHPPNLEAADWLIRRIFPRILAACPSSRLEIVGSNPPASIQQLASERIAVRGHVPSVVPYLERATVVVAPIRSGGGIRVKVIEALAAGKAMVATHRATKGLALTTGDQLLLAETEAQFATAVAHLMNSPSERVAIAGRARSWAESYLSWASRITAYEHFFGDLRRECSRTPTKESSVRG